jgi:hypothetical protein
MSTLRQAQCDNLIIRLLSFCPESIRESKNRQQSNFDTIFFLN